MFKYALVAATALAATASAASWPMVTVNTAGDIVLNSPTRAQSFQLTASTVTAAPTTGTTVSLTSVASLDSTIDSFVASIPSSLNTDGGYKLPTPTVGRQITIFNDGTGAGAFTVWTSATSVFFGNSKTSFAVAATNKWVRFTATSTTNWVIETSSSVVNAKTSLTAGTASALATIGVSEFMGGYYTYTGTTAAGVALTTPTGSEIEAANPGAIVGDTFRFSLFCSSTGAATLTAGASGVTFTDSNDMFVQSGQTATFIVRRTAANAYTVTKEASNNANIVKARTVTASTTLVAADAGIIYSATTALTMTLPTCTASTVGMKYSFYISGSGNTMLIKLVTGDTSNGFIDEAAAGDTDAGTSGQTQTLTNGAAAIGVDLGMSHSEFVCVAANAWWHTSFAGVTAVFA